MSELISEPHNSQAWANVPGAIHTWMTVRHAFENPQRLPETGYRDRVERFTTAWDSPPAPPRENREWMFWLMHAALVYSTAKDKHGHASDHPDLLAARERLTQIREAVREAFREPEQMRLEVAA